MRADRAVEPTKSENITVTWRRSARSSGEALGALDAVVTPAEGGLPVVSVEAWLSSITETLRTWRYVMQETYESPENKKDD